MKNVALNELRGDVKPDQALRDILLNKWGPKPDPFGVGLILEKFFAQGGQSRDGLMTFRDLWFGITNEPWKGIGSRRILSISLSRLLQFCVRNDLPILTTLVVESSSRMLNRQMVLAIYKECKDLGVEVGSDPEAFVARETRRSLRYMDSLHNTKCNAA